MIKWTNQSKNLTREERTAILQRALKCMPYWYQFNFDRPVARATEKMRYDTKDEIAFDYFVTELITNYWSDFNPLNDPKFTVYDTVDDQGFYGLRSNPELSLSFVANFAKWLDPSYERYCDLQSENLVKPISKGSRIVGQWEQTSEPETVFFRKEVCMAGFTSGVRNHYLDKDELALVNASLDADYTYDIFKLDIDFTGKTKQLQIENDRYPRLALAMGAKISTSRPLEPLEVPPKITLMLEDFDYQMKLTNEPISLEFLAPCPPRTLDLNYRYFPTEYYMPPFNLLNFDVTVGIPSYSPESVETSYELYLLTRTI